MMNTQDNADRSSVLHSRQCLIHAFINPSKAVALCAVTAAIASVTYAQEGPVPKGIPHLDHVFVLMMGNHGYNQLVNNPNAPFISHYAKSANTGTNYFAVATRVSRTISKQSADRILAS